MELKETRKLSTIPHRVNREAALLASVVEVHSFMEVLVSSSTNPSFSRRFNPSNFHQSPVLRNEIL